jgi:hypothetical protein
MQAHHGLQQKCKQIFVENPDRRDHLGEEGFVGKIILRYIFHTKGRVMDWNHLTRDKAVVNTAM